MDYSTFRCRRNRENSMEFVYYVLTTSADILELDVRRDKDHNLVIAHDETDGGAVSLPECFYGYEKAYRMRMTAI